MILLDTHVLVWLADGSPSLGKRCRTVVDRALGRDELSVSAFSFWEVAMLATKGRITLGEPPEAFRRKTLEQGVREVAVDGSIAVSAARLAAFHGDPADRIIVATALASHATLVTGDDRLLRWRGGLRARDARR